MIDHDLTLIDRDGERAAYVLPVVAEDASPVAREGLARRRLVALSGVCPCGARLTLPSRRERRAARRAGRVLNIRVEHVPGCPAPLGGLAGDRR